MFKKFFSVSLAFLLIHADARGQAERARELDAQWSAIQALPAGEAIQVGLIKKGTVRGTIVSSTEMTVTVATKGAHYIGKNEVERVIRFITSAPLRTGNLRFCLANR